MAVLDHPSELAPATPLQAPAAIIPAARRRGRRRRALWAAAAVAIIGGLTAAVLLVIGSGAAVSGDLHHRPAPGGRRRFGSAGDAVVAWGDYSGIVHLGDLDTGRQIQIATGLSGGASGGPVIENHGRLLWVDARNTVRSIELATGQRSVVARGLAVMASPGGARLYVDQGTHDFLELDARTLRVTGRAEIPVGWRANPWVARPVAGGLVLMHAKRHGLVLGVWRLGAGVRALGAATGTVLAIHTASDGRSSRVAWVPACSDHAGTASGCPLAITNTASATTIKVPSPSRYGFTSGAFSPNGTQFATFVNTNNPNDPDSAPRSELAIVDAGTGALRLDPKVKMITTEDAAWAVWLPSGRQLLTGAIAATYIVDPRSLAARALYFDGAATPLDSVMGSPDLNFSTLLIPASALSAKQRRALGLGAGAG